MEIRTYDIVIVGAGISGISAIIGASKNSSSILVIDELPSFGGSAVHSEVGTICGILKNYSEDPDFLVNGFPRDFTTELQKKSNSDTQTNRLGLSFIPYTSEAFIETTNSFLKNISVDFLFNSSVFHTEIQNEEILSIDCKNENQTIRVQGKQFIDCSGNSIVSRCAPVSTFPESEQNSAISFIVKGVSAENEMQINLALMKALRVGVSENKINERLLQTFPIQGSLHNSELRLKITLNQNDSLDTGIQLSQEVVSYLSSSEGIFNGISIQRTSSKLGVRSSICSVGQSTLSKNDIISGSRFSNWIAQADWPMEVWKNGKTHLEHSQNGVFYQISAEHITSKYFDNLYFGGKIISSDNEAIASARVQGICLQTGYASGFLAGEKLNNVSKEESIKKLQNELING